MKEKGQFDVLIGIVISNIVLVITSAVLALFYGMVDAGEWTISPLLPLALAGIIDFVVIFGLVAKEFS